MGMIDLFKEFHSQTVEKEYPASARLLGYWFIGEFNEAFWQEELRYSERELSRLTGLSPATVHRAIKYLCDRGHLKTWKKKNKTIFKLLSDKVPAKQSRSDSEAVVKQTRSTNEALAEQSSAVPVIRACEDNKDFKTSDLKTNNSTITPIAGAGACVNRDFENAEIDKIVDYWEESRFGKLDFELMSKLEVYVKKYGYSEVKAAMDSAKESNGSPYGVSFAYFASVLENRNKAKVVPKGGEKVEQPADPRAKWAYSD